MTYRTIVVDPPWHYDATPKGRPGWRGGDIAATSAPLPYRSMTVDEIAALIEHVAPAPRLEMFARRQRLGWDTWGDEALSHVTLETGGPSA